MQAIRRELHDVMVLEAEAEAMYYTAMSQSTVNRKVSCTWRKR